MIRKPGRLKIKRLLLTDRCLQDLAEIERYSINKWGRKVASDYITQVQEALVLVKANPEVLWQETAFHQNLHFYRVKKHVLVFSIQQSEIILLTLFHSAMDIPAKLAEMEPGLIAEVEILHKRLNSK